MSSSSSWEVVRQRRMNVAKNLISSSTPVEVASKPRKPCIISFSTIDTDSSPSIIVRRPLKHRVTFEEKQKPAEAKKKPAEKKTKARINRKKTKPKKLVHSDNDWLTTAEETDDEKENLEESVRSPTKGLALFEDTASPELVREPQAIHEYHFDPPVRQRREDASSPVRIDLGDAEKCLPVEDLPHFGRLFESSDDEEELLPKRSGPVRTYPGVRDRRKKKAEISVDKTKRWLIDLKVPTTAADMLWDAYVKEHPEEMREYIAPPAKRQKKSSSSSSSSSSSKGKATEKEDWRTKKISFGPDEPNKDMHIVRGHYDIISRKWERHYVVKDPYEFPGPKDPEFKNHSSGGSYLRWAGPSSSKNERITKKNVKNTKIKEAKEKLQRSKPVETLSSKDFQRYSDLGSYATRKHIVHPYEFPEAKDAEEICSTGDSDLHRAGPPSSKNERITKKNVKKTKNKEKEKLQRNEPVKSPSSKDIQRYVDPYPYATRKHIVKDQYEFPGPEDAEVEICLTGDSDLHRAGPSSSKNERITKENVKNTKIKEEKEKLQRSEPVDSPSSKDFRRYSDLCSYATRKHIEKVPGPKDAEVEICLTGDLDLHRAGPPSSKNERITKENVKNTKIKEEKEKLQRSEPVESPSSKDFRRYSDLCSYATRLKAKEQKMLSESVAESSNEKTLVSAKKFFKRRKASESNEDDSKRAKIAVKSRPTIKSVRNLDSQRYMKEKDYWRIMKRK